MINLSAEKQIQLERPDLNKESSTQKRLVKICGDSLRGYQFQCFMEIKEIMRIGSQPSMHVWIRLQQLQTVTAKAVLIW